MEETQLMIGSENLLLYPDTVKMSFDEAFSVSVHDIVTWVEQIRTEEKIVHRVDDNLFNQIEIWKAGELGVMGCMLLDKVLPSVGCTELTILIAKTTMFLVGPARKCYMMVS